MGLSGTRFTCPSPACILEVKSPGSTACTAGIGALLFNLYWGGTVLYLSLHPLHRLICLDPPMLSTPSEDRKDLVEDVPQQQANNTILLLCPGVFCWPYTRRKCAVKQENKSTNPFPSQHCPFTLLAFSLPRPRAVANECHPEPLLFSVILRGVA